MKYLFPITLATALLGAAAVASLPLVLPHFEQPDEGAMWRYMVSRLTDVQLHAIHQRAEAEVARNWDEARRHQADFWTDYQHRCSQMSDPAFRARHSAECAMPLNWTDPPTPADRRSVEEVFHDDVLGVCGFVRTIAEARWAGCLPP